MTLLSCSFRLVAFIAVGLCGVQLLNQLSGYSLNGFGLLPRSVVGLWGILFAPFLHQSWAHLASNLAPFCVLGWLVAVVSIRRFVVVSGLIILVGGLLVWLFGRTAIHIGASGWVFGLWGYLLARGCYARSLQNIAIAVLVAFAYGAMVVGLFPAQGVSFESHLAGAFAGILAAIWLARK